jgi:hypothetical protein
MVVDEVSYFLEEIDYTLTNQRKYVVTSYQISESYSSRNELIYCRFRTRDFHKC